LNGIQIISQQELNAGATLVQKPVSLQLSNRLVIQLLGESGSGITVQVIGVDNDPPEITATVSPSPNAAGWNNSNVIVSFTCTDATSGVASCPTPVPVASEGAGQAVSGTAVDKAGNTATTSVTVNLDKTPPTISASINPQPDAGGWNSSPVTVSFACGDALSGVASCASPVTITTEVTGNPITGTAIDIAGNTAQTTVYLNISFNYFKLRSYGGRCLDYGTSPDGSGATVFLNDCSMAQSIRVTEFNDRHEVVLHAGNQVLGMRYVPPPNSGPPTSPSYPFELPLELQTYNPNSPTLRNQVFALDGDSIILATSRICIPTSTLTCPPALALPPPPFISHLVVRIQNAHGAIDSPLVVGTRNFADNEFWDFNALDGTDKDPTTGFQRVSTLCGLLSYIQYSPLGSYNPCPQPTPAGPGTVIKLVPGTSLALDGLTLNIPAGVTLRGDRRGVLFAPLLYLSQLPTSEQIMLDLGGNNVGGNEVRITGLRLQGPCDSSGSNPSCPITATASKVRTWGVVTHDDKNANSIVDHNDIYNWTQDGVGAFGEDVGVPLPGSNYCSIDDYCTGNFDPSSRPHETFVVRNFIHHNRVEEEGYGVESYYGGYPFIEGNTFVSNRHAIAAGHGTVHSGYRAWNNLVLSDAPLQHPDRCILGQGFCFHVQDFDMHGTVQDSFNGCCYSGVGGDYVDILRNTFLGTNRPNYGLRAEPINYSDFHYNVSRRSQSSLFLDTGDAVEIILCITFPICADSLNPTPINLAFNQFSSPDPTNQVGVGDFDADGNQDLFLATGASFYYSPGGAREWRFLSAKTDPINQLLFGDFDGDGRTDVVAMHGGQLVVSWGGISEWKVLNANPCSYPIASCTIADMAVGKFLPHPSGDQRDDIFLADGVTGWYLSNGGSTSFNSNFLGPSSFQRQALRFGHFAICGAGGETDVFGVAQAGAWQVSCGGATNWMKLRDALATDGLIVADFNGDGFADVAKYCGPICTDPGDILRGCAFGCFDISYSGTQDWTTYGNLGTSSLVNGGVGSFSGGPGADVLVWSDSLVSGGNLILDSPGGSGALQPLSLQDMR
jgi:hypothetical protein